MATATFARRVGAAISKGSSSWYDPHMEAASRAILELIPLVDLTVKIRDARVYLLIDSKRVFLEQIASSCSHFSSHLLNPSIPQKEN